MGSFVGRGNQYIQLAKVLYCKLPTTGKQLPPFPHKVWGLTPDLIGGIRVCYHCNAFRYIVEEGIHKNIDNCQTSRLWNPMSAFLHSF